jgi:cyclopropane-fatty-acyl-phospholipid synthase
MAHRYGVTVTAFNLSREQISYARDRAKREGLEGRVTFVEDDYRNIAGKCDAFVSVGMLEHVERRHYAELGAIIRRSLSPTGRALLHTIGRNRPLPPPRWILKRIFPGGNMPTLAEIADVLEPNDFCVLDVENLRLHYAQTLEQWLARFEANRGVVSTMFDERFVRLWRFYLSGALAGFQTGWLQLFQVLFVHRTNHALPWSRREPGESG